VGQRTGKYWAQMNLIDNPWILENIARNPADNSKKNAVRDLTFYS
jgi:hypothetical protein